MSDPEPPGPPRDARWFDRFFAEYSRPVYRYFARRAGVQDAEDLAAEVMATAWRRREDIPTGFELPWLYRTAGFQLANHRRKNTPVPVEQLPEPTADDPQTWHDDPLSAVVTDSAVQSVLAQLTPRERTILLLNAWEGLDGTDLATALGMTRGSAASALSRARSRLRQLWQQDVTHDADPAR